MVGVTIRLDGHSNGVITDINGCYVLTLPEKGGLVIYSYIGFETRKIKVTSRQKVDVQTGELHRFHSKTNECMEQQLLNFLLVHHYNYVNNPIQHPMPMFH